jgi:GNAT superfamily N-acetyltransferase
MNARPLTVVAYQRERHEPAYLQFIAKVLGPEECEHRRKVLASMHERMPGRDRFPLRHVILDGERVAGSLGYMPADFWIGGARVPVRFTHDLLVDPDYRGQGLAKLVVDNARALGDFFPGGMWMTDPCYKIHLACGFDDVAALTTHTLALDVGSFVAHKKLPRAKALVARAGLTFTRYRTLARANRTRARAGSTVKAVDRFDPALDETWAKLGATYAVTLARDAAYLNWRYTSHPHLKYRFAIASTNGGPAGFIVWRPSGAGEKRAVVADFLVAKGDVATFERLLAHVIVHASMAGCHSLSVLTTQSWAARTLRSFGFYPRAVRNTWVIAGWQDRIPKEWLAEHDPWHVVLGDSDGDIWSHAT